MKVPAGAGQGIPAWLPDTVRLYLSHIEEGRSIRSLARREGCHASTLSRKLRRYENRRDDPLVDQALSELGRLFGAKAHKAEVPQEKASATDHKPEARPPMTAPIRNRPLPTDEVQINREARRILRRLSETGAVLAVAADMEKAVVLKGVHRIAVVDRAVAQAFALKDWIAVIKPGKVTTYDITQAGRAALKRLLTEEQVARAPGFAEAQSAFGGHYGEQHREWGERAVMEPGASSPRRMRYNLAESPIAVLARRRDKDGTPFLASDLVTAAERLREDFELAQMGPRVAQNWDRFLTSGDRGSFSGSGGPAQGPTNARDRVALALRDLGPGLGDMVLRTCCFLEGLEVAEKRLGWSARSGKIVLRIALMRLKRHYGEFYGGKAPLIG